MNPGLTPESGSGGAPKGDAHPFGFSADAADRPCPRQKNTHCEHYQFCNPPPPFRSTIATTPGTKS